MLFNITLWYTAAGLTYHYALLTLTIFDLYIYYIPQIEKIKKFLFVPPGDAGAR